MGMVGGGLANSTPAKPPQWRLRRVKSVKLAAFAANFTHMLGVLRQVPVPGLSLCIEQKPLHGFIST